MVAVAILSVGVVLIYRSFLISLGCQGHLTNRLYALNLLEGKISVLQRDYQDKGQVSVGKEGDVYQTRLNNRPVTFRFDYQLSNTDILEDLVELDVALSWWEGPRKYRLTRSVYLFKI